MNQLDALHQEITGTGPVLVILHGLFGDADNFRSIALHFERDFKVIRLDLPGHGQSPHQSNLSFEKMAETVLQHLANEGISSCRLMGHSLGGKVAMQMAGNISDLAIEQLIVVDIAPRLYPPHHTGILNALSNLPLSQIKSRGDADRQLKNHVEDASIRGFLLKNLTRNDAGEYTWRLDLEGIINNYEHMRLPPSFSKTVDCPTLFIKGGNSDYIGQQDEPAIRTHFKDPKFKEIMGTGHWPHAEKPDLFTHICSEFLHH